MNASLLAVLNDAERLLVAETGRAELAVLDEDAAIELETRVRRARNKYFGQYRRGASATVAEPGGRARAPRVPASRRNGTAAEHQPGERGVGHRCANQIGGYPRVERGAVSRGARE
jgi:hypothetical protein